MARKIIWLLLVSAILFGQKCHGSNDSTPKQNELMEQLVGGIWAIANNTGLSKISQELAQIKDTLKDTLDKQTSLMEKLPNNHQKSENYIRSCKDQPSGTYQLKCESCQSPATVYCWRDPDGWGWIVLQQRLDGSENFTRSWQEYRDGFGSVGESTEFWLGLELIHRLTSSGRYDLLIELKNENGKSGHARYYDFKIGGEGDNYRLTSLGDFTGPARDRLSFYEGAQFSTYDRDNDERRDISCSRDMFSGGGWWHKDCSYSSLNGPFKKNAQGYGIFWKDFAKAATFSQMLIHEKGPLPKSGW